MYTVYHILTPTIQLRPKQEWIELSKIWQQCLRACQNVGQTGPSSAWSSTSSWTPTWVDSATKWATCGPGKTHFCLKVMIKLPINFPGDIILCKNACSRNCAKGCKVGVGSRLLEVAPRGRFRSRKLEKFKIPKICSRGPKPHPMIMSGSQHFQLQNEDFVWIEVFLHVNFGCRQNPGRAARPSWLGKIDEQKYLGLGRKFEFQTLTAIVSLEWHKIYRYPSRLKCILTFSTF